MKRYAILRHHATQPGASRADMGPPAGGEPDRFSLSIERLPEKAIAELATDPQVKMITPTMPTGLVSPIDADPASTNWGISAVGADRSQFTGRGVKVAVLDSGIDREHPVFAGTPLVERDFSGHGNGDRQGHGTHCAGILFGRMSNQRIGVARGIEQALIGKVLGNGGTGQSETIFAALLWAMRERADIISLSFGFDFCGMVGQLRADGWPADLATFTALEAYRGNLRMFDSILNVLNAQAAYGASPLVIAAAGNASRREVNPDYCIAATLSPTIDNVIAVAAVDHYDETYQVAAFSNNLPLVAAPGVGIRSAWPGGGQITISGTSMACQYAAGVAALWWEALRWAGEEPSAANVKARLLSSARTDVFAPNTDEADIGHGLVTAP